MRVWLAVWLPAELTWNRTSTMPITECPKPKPPWETAAARDPQEFPVSSWVFLSILQSTLVLNFPRKLFVTNRVSSTCTQSFAKGHHFLIQLCFLLYSVCAMEICANILVAFFKKKKIVLEAEEMSEWWRTCTTLTEDLSSNPSNHVGGLTTTCNSSSSGPHALFWTLRKLHSRVCKHMRMPLPGKDGKWSLSNWALSRTAGLHRHVYWRRKTTGGRSSSQSPSVHTPLVPGPFALPDGCCTLQSCGGAGRSQSHLQGAENTLKAVHSSSPSS